MREKIQKLVSETHGNWLQEYFVSESWVHHSELCNNFSLNPTICHVNHAPSEAL